MKDIDRWLEKMGPEPAGLHELRDAARAVPEMTPQQREQGKRELFAALAEKERQWEAEARRAQTVRLVVRGFGAAFAVAAAVVIWQKWPAQEERETAKGPPLHNTGAAPVTSPSANPSAKDAGPDGAP